MLKKHYLICVLLGLTGNSSAGNMGDLLPSKWGHIVVQGGGFWSNQGKNQHIDILGAIGDDFTLKNSSSGNGLVGVGYYLDGQRWDRVQMNYGVNFFYLAPTSVTGTVFQENIFENLAYRYKVTNYPLYAVAKATIDMNSPSYAITVDGGIGPNFMNTSGFKERSLDGDITIPDHIFGGNDTTSFSATIGAGVRFNHFIPKRPLECGYRFFYLGQGNLNQKTSQVANKLSTGTVYSNAIICSISF